MGHKPDLAWRMVKVGLWLLLVAAFGGGVISGRLTHQTQPRRPPVATTPATTTTIPASADALARVEADVQQDMGYDLQSQVLDVDPVTRGVLANSPDQVQARLTYLELAWVPARASVLAVSYAATIAANAANRTLPSMTAASFVVTRWAGIAVEGASAQLTFTGHYVVTQPRGAGVVAEADRNWAVHASYSDGRWRMADRGLA